MWKRRRDMNPQRLAASVVVVAALAAGVAGCADDSPATTAPSTTAPQTNSPQTTVPSTSVPGSTSPTESTDGADASAPDATNSAGDSAPGSSLPTVDSATAVLVGLTEAEAHDAAAEHGWTVRVARLDGEDQPLTMDFRENRVNVEITDGKVTGVVSVG
jgi:hypothetical protein